MGNRLVQQQQHEEEARGKGGWVACCPAAVWVYSVCPCCAMAKSCRILHTHQYLSFRFFSLGESASLSSLLSAHKQIYEQLHYHDEDNEYQGHQQEEQSPELPPQQAAEDSYSNTRT